MRVKRTTYTFLLLAVTLLVLALSACVRPAPGAENLPAASATPGVIINPTLPLATLPAGGIVDPGAQPGLVSPTPTPLPLQELPPVEASPTPLPPPPEPTAPPASTGEQIHIVQAGENLFRIGLRYGFTAEELAAYNNIPNVNVISVGQQIRIPPTTP